VTPHWVPEQSGSHIGLLDESRRRPTRAQFDAILVPTYRPVGWLDHCVDLALRTRIPLVVVCSKDVHQREVVDMASRANIEAFALDLPSANPLGITFATSSDAELAAASPGWTRDVSMKRNLGLILARLLGWTRLMFLDDDIYDVTEDDVAALAAALDDHSVSALIPIKFPDNSVACHAHRDGGGIQEVFASASGIGVRCDRDDLAFFPNIYNEDWFFFSEEAACHKIAKVGVSHQLPYDPYDSPLRAAQEEFGDLLAEGLYARLDINEGIFDVDADYWRTFIDRRKAFHERVAVAIDQHPDRELATKAGNSVRAARDQLNQIRPSLCQKFVELWQSDLVQWRRYLTKLPRVDSVVSAFEYLGLDFAVSHPRSR
jgi:hypothetical protein